MPDTPLAIKLKARIDQSGPISVAAYMDACLADPDHGYYRTRDPFGARGDFTTAPEISQVFGELIGLWSAALWQFMGSPKPIKLIELGPGRGTLMADALRAARTVPDFLPAAEIHLVETSPVLRDRQADSLKDFAPHWHGDLADVPPGASIIVANEFLDALPVHQYVRRKDGWHERLIGHDTGSGLVFTETPHPLTEPPDVAAELEDAAGDGAIAEWRPAAGKIVKQLGARARAHPLAALFIDYGHERSAIGDTLQAVSRHGFTDPLAAPGDQDLTAHVDFDHLSRRAAAAGLGVHGPVSQGTFLQSLGLAQRCEQLMKGKDPDTVQKIGSGAQRLIDPDQMGTLFMGLALTGADIPAPPGFEPEG